MTRRKKQVYALRGSAVVGDQASEERFAEITSGRSRWQQGLVATCEDFLHEPKAQGKKSQMGSSYPDPLLGPGPLRTGRDSFPSSGSSTSNASLREARFGYRKTQAVNPVMALGMK